MTAYHRQKGSSFERLIADYLALHVDDRVDRRAKTGAKDKGDIGGLRHMGERIVVECKNTSTISLSTWANEAETERGNDDATVGVIAHKARGKGKPEDQWVTMRLSEFVALLTGNRDHLEN